VVRRIVLLAAAAAALPTTGCGSDDAAEPPPSAVTTGVPAATTEAPPPGVPAEDCAHVVSAGAALRSSGAWTFTVTVRSADTGWEKYADAWEVVGVDGTVYGRRELAHPHVEEQPFTRILADVALPDGVDVVNIRARDSVAGFCGETATVEVPR
jgi:hypothetical protein